MVQLCGPTLAILLVLVLQKRIIRIMSGAPPRAHCNYLKHQTLLNVHDR